MSRAKSPSLYDGEGFLNFSGLVELANPFLFVVAARGTGKTFGACEWLLNENVGKFLFLRRTVTQADIIKQDAFSPFRGHGVGTVTKSINKYVSGVYELVSDEASGSEVGYIAGLSRISNVRGFMADEITAIVYDEFIPEQHEKPFAKDEAQALWNAYETINRNRELQGREPVKLICLANSNKLDNDYFVSLGIVAKAWEMSKKGEELYVDKGRGIAICQPLHSPISAAKEKTALYKAVGDGRFRNMALGNSFDYDDSKISSRPLRELKPVLSVGELTVYQHKSKAEYYVSQHSSGGRVPHYDSSEDDLGRFKRAAMWLYRAELLGMVYYEDVISRVLLDRYFK